jgi:uncharacterized SAM-binding protein YcdF (DUF218 family)
MFFIASKIFVHLIYPVFAVCLLLAGAWWFWSRRPRLGRGLLVTGLALLWLLGTAPVADLLLLPLETRYPVVENPSHADAVVVLTGMVDMKAARGDQVELGQAGDRILAGVKLVRQGRADYLLIAGGSGDLFDQSISEALVLNRLAIELGVPADRILLDTSSRNTHENAVQSKAVLQEAGLSDAILVTSAMHMPRSMGCFRKVGLHLRPYPVDFQSGWGKYDPMSWVPRVGNLQRSTLAVREYVGLVMYSLQGYI